MPDLVRLPSRHKQMWSGFHLKNPHWTTKKDERFENWKSRYLEGSWKVKSGPRVQLEEAMKTINSVMEEVIGKPLFKKAIPESLPLPSAENTHRYEDAHAELYRYLIDGLDKESIALLATHLQRPGNFGSDRTIQALKKALPALADISTFDSAFNTVSEQRRRSDHQARPAAMRFPATERFTQDLWACVVALQDLIRVLESELKLNAKATARRHEAKAHLPVIEAEADPHFSICQAEDMKGKTVERVQYGTRKQTNGLHRSEVLIIHFTDGSILGIDTGSNVGNLASENVAVRPEDFHVDFFLQWVPEK